MEVEKKMTSIFYFKKYLEEIIMETYEEFINNILETRGRFACGEEYHERHHIVPKCIGGSNDEDNLIDLYAREHFEAHRLLALENPEVDSLVYAWWNMSHINKANGRNYEISSEEYEEAKIAFSIMHSKPLKGMFAGEKIIFMILICMVIKTQCLVNIIQKNLKRKIVSQIKLIGQMINVNHLER